LDTEHSFSIWYGWAPRGDLPDTDFTRRQDRFLSDNAYRRLAEIRAERDPTGRIASYLTSDLARLNVHG